MLAFISLCFISSIWREPNNEEMRSIFEFVSERIRKCRTFSSLVLSGIIVSPASSNDVLWSAHDHAL